MHVPTSYTPVCDAGLVVRFCLLLVTDRAADTETETPAKRCKRATASPQQRPVKCPVGRPRTRPDPAVSHALLTLSLTAAKKQGDLSNNEWQKIANWLKLNTAAGLIAFERGGQYSMAMRKVW